jgi:peptidoglycan hydrolase-like protein with peptidoglycan-binding domain
MKFTSDIDQEWLELGDELDFLNAEQPFGNADSENEWDALDMEPEEFETEEEAGRRKLSARRSRGSRGASRAMSRQMSRTRLPRMSPARPRWAGLAAGSRIIVQPPVLQLPPAQPGTPSPGRYADTNAPPAGGSPAGSSPDDVPPPSDSTEYVRWVQTSLNQILRLRLPKDGIMGPETRSAIRSFQERWNLPVTGIVDPDTERSILSAFSSLTIENHEMERELEFNRRNPDDIRWAQQSLNQILKLGLAVDGIMGPLTRSAVRSFQQKYGLIVDGIIGPLTEAALRLALTGKPPIGDPGTTPASPPDTSRLTAIRMMAEQLIDAYVPSDTGDPRFDEIAQDFGGMGTTCGFLCHWLLWRLGCTNREIVNRKAPGGFTYRIGQNISRIWNLAKPPFVSALNNSRLQEGFRPQLGDIVFIKSNPNERSGAGEHVFVFLQEVMEANGTFWVGADAGIKNEAGRECSRKSKRQLILRGKGGMVIGKYGTARVIMGWLSLANLSFGIPPR